MQKAHAGSGRSSPFANSAEAVFFYNKYLIEVTLFANIHWRSATQECGASSSSGHVTWEFVGHAVLDLLNYSPHFNKISR